MSLLGARLLIILKDFKKYIYNLNVTIFQILLNFTKTIKEARILADMIDIANHER